MSSFPITAPTAAVPVSRTFQVSLIWVNGRLEFVVPVTKTIADAVMPTVLAGLATSLTCGRCSNNPIRDRYGNPAYVPSAAPFGEALRVR
jgi:hypothetical protein